MIASFLAWWSALTSPARCDAAAGRAACVARRVVLDELLAVGRAMSSMSMYRSPSRLLGAAAGALVVDGVARVHVVLHAHGQRVAAAARAVVVRAGGRRGDPRARRLARRLARRPRRRGVGGATAAVALRVGRGVGAASSSPTPRAAAASPLAGPRRPRRRRGGRGGQRPPAAAAPHRALLLALARVARLASTSNSASSRSISVTSGRATPSSAAAVALYARR